MKLELPTHVPLRYVASFSAAMLALEVVEGTPVTLALTAQAFVLVSAVAFNVAGGLMYPSGACIFFNAVLSMILGMVVKGALGEPLQSNLLAPQQTLLVYLAGMASILVAVLCAVRLRPQRGLLERVDPGRRLEQMGLGCLLMSFFVPYLIPASTQGTFAQFNNAFVFFAILLPVYQRVRETGGRRSFHYVAFVAWLYLTYVYGIGSYSKQGLFSPSAAWAIAAVAAGYRTTLTRVVLVGTLVVAAVALLTPYSQLARNHRGEPDEAKIAMHLLLHPLETRRLYNEEARLNYILGGDYHWFNEPEGLLDRLTMVPIDDALIHSTDTRRAGSPLALWSYVLNMVPRYLYPDKPPLMWGNIYAHDIGIIGEGDYTTGISFTPYADGYHTARWLGVTLYLGLFFFAMFAVCDAVSGSIARSQWGLIFLIYFEHAASEGMLGMTTYAISNTSVALICAAYILTYVAPVVGSLFVPVRRQLQRA